MKKIIISFVFFLFSSSIFSQAVDCEDLIDYVKSNGSRKATVNSWQLINSEWLKEVEAWEIDDAIVVIASIKKDQYTFLAKDYIFCGIPSRNWDNFYNSWSDVGKTYGEKFHLYIIDYICNCN